MTMEKMAVKNGMLYIQILVVPQLTYYIP